MQTVPKYSAVKINGKKLYEYARENVSIELPKREVEIYSIELLDYNIKEKEFTFKTLVSKGTYIRSLIDDIGNKLNIPMTMKELRRTKSGKFKIEDVNDNIIPIKDALDYKKVILKDEDILKKVLNGNEIEFTDDSDYIIFLNEKEEELGIYKKDKTKYKAFKIF